MTDEQLAAESIAFFLRHYKITNDQGLPLDFKDHKYLQQIYADFTPKQAVLKAAQIGFSTTANIKALWVAKNKGLDIIYSLPSAADIKDFVSGKTNRLIDNNPILASWTADKDSIEQKRVGQNVIYFKGTWTERAAIATPADLYISDETDRSKAEIVTQFKTRLQHSKFGWEWYFSNPSAPGHGVDHYWQLSDQKHWFVKCGACNHWQFITLKHIIKPSNGQPFFGCEKCHKELDRSNGKWVKRWQDKHISGYWIPWFVSPRVNAGMILEKQKEMGEGQFTNFVLGQPWIGKNSVLLRQMFLQNLVVNEANPQTSRPIIGVDTGVGINVVAGNSNGLFFYEKYDDYAPIEALLNRWPNAICIIDQGGDIIGPRKLREKYPNRVFLCFFGKDRKNDQLIKWNDEDGTVIADRNKLIQLCVDEFIEKRMPVYGSESDWHDFMTEWLGMYRTEETSDVGPPIFEWHKPSTGRCDYPFAQVYLRIGLDRFMETKATFHDPNSKTFASPGLDVQPDGHTVLLKPTGSI